MRSEPENATIFSDTTPSEYRAWALPVFVAVSLLAHGAVTLLFKVIYPAPRRVELPAATLSVVRVPAAVPQGSGVADATSAEEAIISEWLEGSDPALLTQSRAYLPDFRSLERGRYAPLFERWAPEPAQPPENTPFMREAEQAAAQLKRRQPEMPQIHAAPIMDLAWLGLQDRQPAKGPDNASGTTVRITPLAARLNTPRPHEVAAPQGPELPPLVAQAELDANVQPAEYLVGIAPGGQVLYTLTRQSSNSALLDLAAMQYLRSLPLDSVRALAGPPTNQPVEWLYARITWGREVFRP